ncbi:MAG: 30S ribosomal protein S9 [Flavobacteriales bacterium]|jgi:small subunit ribosomal protein S9|nr:30S ribosomal protein S9 [Flavobacteriales bacterium]MBT4479210.1 30S ribosomal protein S9 [Flavobacteriales bacterium]MBT4738029.1 30S ribosomal protein S9 [Flavobacteriales bacterium]MBT5699247.1 30S ribosomal protein S9 [Flavobacteriales bacterium]MBT6699070.1 30S ribosomal protein S9 [Flavobacteriales bacterium]
METVHTIGRRKASVARIYVTKGKGNIVVNGKDYKEYFPLETLQYKLNQPFKVVEQEGKFDIKVSVNGGGINGQADAIKLAIARSLCEIDIENRPSLKAEGLLTRDPRVVERKKPGQKKARKKFQWVKR